MSLVLLAGSNGAGKTTLYQARVAPGFAGPFITAGSQRLKNLRSYRPVGSTRDRLGTNPVRPVKQVLTYLN
jgi:ABC-type multidrug transport system ATPase subunit